MRELIDLDKRSYRGFFSLVERKFMSKIYNYLSTDHFAQRDRMDRGRAFDFMAQAHMYKMAQTLLTKEQFEYYFINPNDRSAGWGNYQWGGNQNTVQGKLAKFQEFTSKHLEGLSQIASSIWPEDVGYGYAVTPIGINTTYDIDKQGYWIRYTGDQVVSHINDNASGSFNIKVTKHGEERITKDGFKSNIGFEYLPEHDFELAQKGKQGGNIFLKIPEIPFSVDRQKSKTVYLVQKIKLSYMGLNTNYRTSGGGVVLIGVTMEDPKIEFYKEDTLKNKIFEASLAK